MDVVYLGLAALVFALTWGLLAGCAALGSQPEQHEGVGGVEPDEVRDERGQGVGTADHEGRRRRCVGHGGTQRRADDPGGVRRPRAGDAARGGGPGDGQS